MSNQETYNETVRALAKALFAKDEPDEPDAPDPATANLVPLEGANPTGEAHDMRALAERLFFNPND